MSTSLDHERIERGKKLATSSEGRNADTPPSENITKPDGHSAYYQGWVR
jgi:hypothetical protein